MEISDELFDRFVIDLNDGLGEENQTALISCLNALFIGCCRNYEKKISELKEGRNEKIEDHQKENEKLKNENEKLKNENKKLKDDIKEIYDNYSGANQKLRNLNEELISQIDDLKRQIR